MPRSWSSLLLVLVVVAQSALGGFRAGGAVLCLGGGHDHEPAASVVAEAGPCHGHCCDAEPWPTAVPAELHDGHCSCIDVDLSRTDLGAPRDDATAILPPAPMAHAAIAFVAIASTGAPVVRDHGEDPGPALRHRARIVRSTLLLI